MPVTALQPVTRVILQTATGFYSLTWDSTAALRIDPATGVGTASHGDKTYSLVAADPTVASPAAPLSADQPYNPDAGTIT